MDDVLVAVGVAFATVFVAELGDKTQLLTLALATRIRPGLLLAGLAVTIAVLCGLAVGVGAVLGESIPERPVTIAAGVLFIAFGLWTLRPEPDEPDDARLTAGEVDHRPGSARSELSELTAAMAAFFLAELGDKTQLASLTLATQRHPLGVWLGASLAMLAANALALVVGRMLGTRIPARPLRLASAALFIVVGVVLLVDGIRG